MCWTPFIWKVLFLTFTPVSKADPKKSLSSRGLYICVLPKWRHFWYWKEVWTAWGSKAPGACVDGHLKLESNSQWGSFSLRPSDAHGTVWGQILVTCGLRNELHHKPTQQTCPESLCRFICVLLKDVLLSGKNVYRDIKQGPGGFVLSCRGK